MNSTPDPYQQAKDYALRTAGLDWAKRDAWTDTQRTAYLRANGEFRTDNPHLFSDAALAAGNNYIAAANEPEPKFDLRQAVKDSLAESTRETFGGIGSGVGAMLSGVPVWARWLGGAVLTVLLLGHVATLLPRKK